MASQLPYLLIVILILNFADVLSKPRTNRSLVSYHNYEQMTHLLKRMAKIYPQLSHLESIGQSVQGRDIWALTISAKQPSHHVLLRPDVALMANMHGNEVVGKELLLYLSVYLLTKYGNDKKVTHLLDTRRIHLLPSINPDGLAMTRGEGDCEQAEHIGRENARKVDLNRDFHNRLQGRKGNGTEFVGEPETVAIMKWLDSVNLVLTANLHGGALVANYPWDGNVEQKQTYTSAPDDDVLSFLALTYSSAHSSMYKGLACDVEDEVEFPHGIVNGASWYPVDGSLQDYQYAFKGTMALTLEVSCCKYPLASSLGQYWMHNLPALIALLDQADKGIRGLVLDSDGLPISCAELMVLGRDITFHASPYGEFWRLLLPGEYILKVKADGYAIVEVPFEAPSTSHDPPFVTLNITLLALHKETDEFTKEKRPNGAARSYELHMSSLLMILLVKLNFCV